jgi:hypothetical protein
MTNIDRFWKAYPKRNGRKIGKKDCTAWFVQNKPSPQTVEDMLKWIKVDIANRGYFEKTKGFYAPPKDPIRFLRGRQWEDDLDCVCKEAERLQETKATTAQDRKVGRFMEDYRSYIETQPLNDILHNGHIRGMCKEFPELREWAVSVRPDLRGAKAEVAREPEAVPVVQDIPPPRERKLAKMQEYYRDVVKLKGK